jgi:hypothetical protein
MTYILSDLYDHSSKAITESPLQGIYSSVPHDLALLVAILVLGLRDE